MSKVRVVIADDERPARSYLKKLLSEDAEVEVVGEAENGSAAIKVIEQERPDLVLLDLQMPEMDGIEVVRMLMPETMPLIAFVTAYDEYAVKAFEVNAVDYLLKPVNGERLSKTLARAKARLAHSEERKSAVSGVVAASAAIEQNASDKFLKRIPVRRKDDIVFVNVDDITSIVADGEILHIYTDRGERYVITYRLKELEARLDSDEFIRISRSVVVNVNDIAKVSPMPGGTYIVTLTNRQEFPSSRSRSKTLRETMFRL